MYHPLLNERLEFDCRLLIHFFSDRVTNMIPCIKKRGRPRKTTNKNPAPNPKEQLIKEMKRCEYKLKATIIDEHVVLQRNEYMESLLQEPNWKQDTEILKGCVTKLDIDPDVAHEIWMRRNIEGAAEYLDNQLDIQEDDNPLDMTPEVKQKRLRVEYLSKYEPLQQFKEGSLKDLPTAKQQILEENRSLIFNEQISYQEQVELVIHLIYDPTRNSGCGPTAIGKLFGVSKGTIAERAKRMQRSRRAIVGRPAALDDTQLALLIDYCRQKYIEKTSPNIFHLIDYIFSEFHVSININTLRSIIRRCPLLKPVKGMPLEATRAETPVEVVLQHYAELDEMLLKERVPPEFFFNVDESGFQAYADSQKETVIIPYDGDESSTYYSVDRSAKRSTLVGCICLDGSALKPLVIIPNKTVTQELRIRGYNDSNCLIVCQECGFINTEAFVYWAQQILFPEIAAKREQYGYEGVAVLTMDGCSSHFSDFFLDECTYQNIYPWKEPPGTSDQVQALDLGIFGRQKKCFQRYNPETNLASTDKDVIAIVNSWRRSTCPDAVVSSFNQAGIYIECDTEGNRIVRAAAEKGRAVRGIQHSNSDNVIQGRKTTKVIGF